ncbi:UDP-3-O-(3-hydroxymyristoyl)glucosamine N-acyltransferase [Thalassomonas haliotis]|uniref:UDP-3-O-acylglucosamine N-acyltransferase n=1 Tax=Thalassomonas haliotis TaxID=485448 RepID=A0ABY7V9T8_9GAMM|nr:UDP-3-O-(3-hydroxymyristoyl)glucosamine N-acyltransferase [Thalassomonas haliotis]WDE10429.1 UDP-3-O-(3-hydroxymyristoyl)glucosamine N-acyltransferase [Thalassomonas haliotis]
MNYTLAELAQKIGAEVSGDENITVSSLATLEGAGAGQIAFLANSKYRQSLAGTNASAVILARDSLADCPTNALVMANPYMGYALVAQLLDTTPMPAQAIHASAVVDASANIGENVTIGANAVISAGVTLADGASIGAGCFIGEQAVIGKNTRLWANVSVYHKVSMGQDCLVQSGSVIGSDGFGYAPNKGQWLKIPQLGTVVVGDRVEIGASTTIDRGALENTVIGDGVILDNQIQIAHNVIIGDNTAVAGCSVIAGSAVIGKNCTIAGMVAINGHMEIADGCVFTGRAMVTKAIKEPGVYSSGMPCMPNKEWNKTNARIKKLDQMAQRIKTLEKELAEIKK